MAAAPTAAVPGHFYDIKQEYRVKFISNRDIVVRSKHGHAIEFLKGVPTDVPRVMHGEVMERGILPSEGVISEEDSTVHDVKLRLAPEDALDREDRILDAIKAIIKRNNASDFTGGGRPHMDAVTALVGWRVDQKETNKVWEKNRNALLAKD